MSATPSRRIDVPGSLEEDYYQISPEILQSFNKFRPPLNLFRYKEEIGQLQGFYSVGQRLSSEQIENLAQLVEEGFIFVSRADHPVYVQHISHQLDLILVDKNLKESEIADVIVLALTARLEAFFEQTIKLTLDRLNLDVLTLTEYLWGDFHRVKALLRRLRKQHTLANHSFNSGVVGLAIYVTLYEEGLKQKEILRKSFDRTALGLFLHDLGMTKIPAFIRSKVKPLMPDERNKLLAHTNVGYEMLERLDLKWPEIEKCVMHHHERLNGQGYPQRLKDRDVPPLGRLCALADSYAAMISERPYAKAMDSNKALIALVQDNRYDPDMAKVLLSLMAVR